MLFVRCLVLVATCRTFVVEVYSETKDNVLRRTEWLNSNEFIVLSADNVLRSVDTSTSIAGNFRMTKFSQMAPKIKIPG